MAAPLTALWIVHADPAARVLLRRYAGVAPSAEGGPSELDPSAAPAPRVVLLHIGADLTAALEFAVRTRQLHPDAGFVLLREEAAVPPAALAAFADLGAEEVAWPSHADALAAALVRAGRRTPTGLAARRRRDALVRRFARTLGDLGLPDLGGLRTGRVVIRGEPGTGKLLTAHLIHALAEPPGALVYASCSGSRALPELAERLAAAGAAERTVVCLDRPERLSPEAQQELAGWVELGPPGLALDPDRTVWIALLVELAGAEPRLAPSLALALRGLELVLPPLRRRPGAAERFAETLLRSLAEAAGQAPRALAPDALAAIRSAPWPENTRELEAALRGAVARAGAEPIPAVLLGLASEPAAPAAPGPSIPSTMRVAKGAARPAERAPEPPAPAARPAERAPEPPAPAAQTTTTSAKPPALAASGRPASRALLQALAHALRNPLVSLKTFSTLLPEHWGESDFRERFHAQADRDLASVERHVERLARFAELTPTPAAPVDVAALLESLLHERRDEIHSRRLLVLSELGADAPWALASEAALRFACAALLDLVFAQIRDRQDLFVSCRVPSAPAGPRAPLRVQLRFHGTPLPQLPPAASGTGRTRAAALELALAEAALEPYGGRVAYEPLAGDEQLLHIDLPAAAAIEK
jgi:DNA-binding NtrC family response regulator